MATETPASSVFEGYRAIGLVTNDKPFLIKYGKNDKDTRIVTCVGRYFYTFTQQLVMVGASHAHEFDINVITCNEKYVFTASNTEIFAWIHGNRHLCKVYKHHDAKIIFLKALGSHLLSIDNESMLCITNIATTECISQIPFYAHQFKISAICHPSTYINKLLLGSEQGTLQLFNFRTQKIIYRYAGWQSKVTCIEQSPAIDIVAIGLENGGIHLHNLKTDETLMSFRQEWGPVLRLSFRTDGPAVLVSSSELGHLAVWDIENRRLLTQMKYVHDGPITGCEFIFQEPLLITSSSDNSIKIWRFDQSDGKGDLLSIRQGHSLPPTKIEFYSPQGHQIISASKDQTVRLFSIFSERLHKNLGCASSNRKYAKRVGLQSDPNKLPPVTNFSFSLAREATYDNFAAIHADSQQVTTWRVQKHRMGEHQLQHAKHTSKANVVATSVLVTPCGNFTIIGYNNGDILKYNIQSGKYRGCFVRDESGKNLIRSPIVGFTCDELCTVLISAQNDQLYYWHFKSRKLINIVQLPGQVIFCKSNNQGNLLAIAFADNSLAIVDLETRRIIRKFACQAAKINDVIFSSDCKWLIVALANRAILMYDLLSAELIDHFLVTSACTSLSLSPTGEFLATAHDGQKGIFLWANVTMYEPKLLRPLSATHEPKLLDLPTAIADDRTEQDDLALEDAGQQLDEIDEQESEEQTDLMAYISPEQIAERLITLSGLATSRWKNLVYLDLIKKRNQPKKPVEKPKDAPFFLPVLGGLNPTLDVSKEDEQINSKLVNRLVLFSEFGQLLFDAGIQNDFTPVLAKLKEMGPSAIDVEIRSLDALPPSSEQHKINEPILIKLFLKALLQGLQTNRDFELINSYLALTLNCHSEEISHRPEYSDVCKEISLLIDESWDRLKHKFAETACILNYIRNAVI